MDRELAITLLNQYREKLKIEEGVSENELTISLLEFINETYPSK